jgi:hypothetical protein
MVKSPTWDFGVLADYVLNFSKCQVSHTSDSGFPLVSYAPGLCNGWSSVFVWNKLMSLEYLARQLPDPIRNRPYIAIPGGQMALAAIRHLYRPAAHARLHKYPEGIAPSPSRPSIGQQQQQQQSVPRYLSRCQPASYTAAAAAAVAAGGTGFA